MFSSVEMQIEFFFLIENVVVVIIRWCLFNLIFHLSIVHGPSLDLGAATPVF